METETGKISFVEAFTMFVIGIVKRERLRPRYAKVDTVHDGYIDCTFYDSDMKLTKVQTCARVDKFSNGISYKPKVGSVVAISYTDRTHAYVSMFSEIDEIDYMGTQYGGFSRSDSLTTKLNNIENKVNAIINAYNVHTHLDPVSGSTGTPSAPVVGSLTPTQQNDIQNNKLKHG